MLWASPEYPPGRENWRHVQVHCWHREAGRCQVESVWKANSSEQNLESFPVYPGLYPKRPRAQPPSRQFPPPAWQAGPLARRATHLETRQTLQQGQEFGKLETPACEVKAIPPSLREPELSRGHGNSNFPGALRDPRNFPRKSQSSCGGGWEWGDLDTSEADPSGQSQRQDRWTCLI